MPFDDKNIRGKAFVQKLGTETNQPLKQSIWEAIGKQIAVPKGSDEAKAADNLRKAFGFKENE